MTFKQLQAHYKKLLKKFDKQAEDLERRKQAYFDRQNKLTSAIRERFIKSMTELSTPEFCDKMLAEKYYSYGLSHTAEPEIVLLARAFQVMQNNASECCDKKKIPVEIQKALAFLRKSIINRIDNLPDKRRSKFKKAVVSGLYNITRAQETCMTAKEKKLNKSYDDRLSHYSSLSFKLSEKADPIRTAYNAFTAKVVKKLPKPNPDKKGQLKPVIVPLPNTTSFDEMVDMVVDMTGIRGSRVTSLEHSALTGSDSSEGMHYIMFNRAGMVCKGITAIRKASQVHYFATDEKCEQVLTDKKRKTKPELCFLTMDSDGEYLVGFAYKTGVVMFKAGLYLAMRKLFLAEPKKYAVASDAVLQVFFDKRDPVLKVVSAKTVKERKAAFDKLDDKTQKQILRAFKSVDVAELNKLFREKPYNKVSQFIREHKGNLVPLAALASVRIGG